MVINHSNDKVWLAPFILFLIGQLLSAVIWLTYLGARVSQLESTDARLADYIQRIDKDGTRALGVVEDRQIQMLHRLDQLEQHH